MTQTELLEALRHNCDYEGGKLYGRMMRFDTEDFLSTEFPAFIPRIAHIDAAILRCVSRDTNKRFDMNTWYHCRGGWAIYLTGAAGTDLEMQYGSLAAASLIYAASRPGVPPPDFYTDEETALADMKLWAEKDPLPV